MKKLRVEIWEDEENKEENEEGLEGDFLEGRAQNVIPAGYESDSNESMTFPNHIIREECCWVDSPRPHGKPVAHTLIHH